jgi:thymidylate kinase
MTASSALHRNLAHEADPGPQESAAPDWVGFRRESGRDATLARLEAAGVEYCLLRGEPSAAGAGDLDLLIDPASRERAARLLTRLGFVCRRARSPYKLVFVRYAEGVALCLDVHLQPVQDGMIYMDGRRMLNRRERRGGVFCLSREDELIHLVIHNVMRRGGLRAGPLERIRTLFDGPLDRAYLDSHLDEFGLRPVFRALVAWLRTHDTIPPALGRRLRRALYAAAPGNAPRHLALRLRRAWLPARTGGLVALIGPDGSGKSTVTKAICERARQVPFVKIQTTYLGPWGQLATPLVPALRRRGIKPAADGEHARGSVWHECRAAMGGGLFYLATWLDLLARYVRTARGPIRRGRWVVSDRYVTDLRYLYKARPISRHRLMRYLVCRLFPAPDLFVLLDNRPEIVAARKDQLSESEIRRHRQCSLKAIEGHPHEVVPTDQPPDRIADHILRRMIELDGRP